MSTERVIVQKRVADKLMEHVVALVGKVKATTNPGPGIAQVGPLFSPVHADNFLSMLENAKQAGADVL